eukprot:TRINITY_DN19650_c0_g1_i3.p1 TRINITY_DN19650_c0_g1~~TRINITY_DN19650_c0_g1_i3.p1  ORF type:complete len:137 (-),score=34.53 TRINITY_DN19650_c0_g1_i3:33-383(-)
MCIRDRLETQLEKLSNIGVSQVKTGCDIDFSPNDRLEVIDISSEEYDVKENLKIPTYNTMRPFHYDRQQEDKLRVEQPKNKGRRIPISKTKDSILEDTEVQKVYQSVLGKLGRKAQ